MINNGKAKIENSIERFSISIPSKKNWGLLIFGTAWLGGWFFGFKSASSMLFSSQIESSGALGFMSFWLIGWTFGGLAIITILLWGYFGKEKFVIENGQVLFEKTIFGIGKKKRFELNEIRNIRTEKNASTLYRGNGMALWGIGSGKIIFDYGLKTFSFGLGVDDAEAIHITQILIERFKQ